MAAIRLIGRLVHGDVKQHNHSNKIEHAILKYHCGYSHSTHTSMEKAIMDKLNCLRSYHFAQGLSPRDRGSLDDFFLDYFSGDEAGTDYQNS